MSENKQIADSELASKFTEGRAFIEREIQRLKNEIVQSRDSIRNLGFLNKKTVDEIKSNYQSQVDAVIRECKDRFEAEESKLQELIDKISISALSRHFSAKAKNAKKLASNFLMWFYIVIGCAFLFGISIVHTTWEWIEVGQPFFVKLKFHLFRF